MPRIHNRGSKFSAEIDPAVYISMKNYIYQEGYKLNKFIEKAVREKLENLNVPIENVKQNAFKKALAEAPYDNEPLSLTEKKAMKEADKRHAKGDFSKSTSWTQVKKELKL